MANSSRFVPDDRLAGDSPVLDASYDILSPSSRLFRPSEVQGTSHQSLPAPRPAPVAKAIRSGNLDERDAQEGFVGALYARLVGTSF